MKIFKLFSAVLCAILVLVSYSGSKKDDELSGHLLIGPYGLLAQGPAFADRVSAHIPAGENDPEKLIEPYKKIFAFPHSPVIKAQYMPILLEEHKVTDKASALKRVAALIEEGNNLKDNKAFKYAVAANVVSMSHGSGFLSDAEAKAENQNILTAVRKHYSSWEDYLEDIPEGRKVDANVKSPELQPMFEELTKSLLSEETSPYKIFDL